MTQLSPEIVTKFIEYLGCLDKKTGKKVINQIAMNHLDRYPGTIFFSSYDDMLPGAANVLSETLNCVERDEGINFCKSMIQQLALAGQTLLTAKADAHEEPDPILFYTFADIHKALTIEP